ncbi:hypothetical protein CUU62_27150 [Pseudomonas sp. WP001]|nr:hypothetical protein CUU62_27150 [Pseudomonas sp. WP001]
MNKNFGDMGLMFVYCTLIFISGVVFGFIFTNGGQVSFVAFLGALSSIATVGAAIIAVIALKGWKEQFKFQKKYDAILELRTFLHGCADSYTFLASLRDHFVDHLRAGSITSLSDNYPFEAQRRWFSHINDMSRSWDMVNVLLTRDERVFFKQVPTDIRRLVGETQSEITRIVIQGADGADLQIFNEVNEGLEKIDEAYKRFEIRTRLFLKKITTY